MAAEWMAEQEELTLPQVRAISTIAATCGLIHDIGNPPFGHAGEQAISTWFHKQYADKENPLAEFAASFDVTGSELRREQLANDFWNFEGNAHMLRLVARLQILQTKKDEGKNYFPTVSDSY